MRCVTFLRSPALMPRPGEERLIEVKSLRRLGPWAPNPVFYQSRGKALPRNWKKNGVWGPWPQPPEALDSDKLSFAPSGIIRLDLPPGPG